MDKELSQTTLVRAFPPLACERQSQKQEEPDILCTRRLGWLTPIRAVRALRVIGSANYASQKLFTLRAKTFVFGYTKKERRKLLSKLAPH